MIIQAIMETRLQRYAKYRETIRRLPDDVFNEEGHFNDKLTASQLKELSRIGSPSSMIGVKSETKPALDVAPDEGQVSPYSFYLARKRVWWIVKAIVVLLVLGGLVAFFFLFVWPLGGATNA